MSKDSRAVHAVRRLLSALYIYIYIGLFEGLFEVAIESWPEWDLNP